MTVIGNENENGNETETGIVIVIVTGTGLGTRLGRRTKDLTGTFFGAPRLNPLRPELARSRDNLLQARDSRRLREREKSGRP